jgi:uncharacterized protein (DUF1800 family)
MCTTGRILRATAAAILVLFAPLAAARSKKPAFSQVTVHNPLAYSAFSHPLLESEMTRHALDRLTFGPGRDELEQTNRLGLAKWLDVQLHPENMAENPILAQKLAPFESLRMSIHETYVLYPQRQMVVAVARGLQPLPDDPELREVVQHLVQRYQRRKATGAARDAIERADDEASLEPSIPFSQIVSPQQVDKLQHGSDEQKSQVLASVPSDRALDFAYAIRAGERRQLLPLAPVPLQRTLLLSIAPSQVVLLDLTSAKILRAIYSTHQLEEEMVDFWFNHFNVFFDKGSDRFMLPAYEREAIRPHALGKFHDLLVATAKSPAMLFYLDNAQSVAPDPGKGPRHPVPTRQRKRGLNENYARELMELHTLGVNGGYTQKDVVEVARCFTGWTISPPRRDSAFEFNERVHDRGQKIVLGHVIPAGGGISDGLKVLEILARAPRTAQHLSLELAQRFVADDPPPSLVSRMATSYLRTDGDIREVLKTMVLSPEFFSEGAYRAKIKTPFEMVVSAVRTANADVDSPLVLGQQIAQLGEPLYRKIEPTGYSNVNTQWISSAALLSRMNFALALASNQLPGVRVSQEVWQQMAQNDPMNVAHNILCGEPEERTAAAIRKMLTTRDAQDELVLSARLRSRRMASLVAGVALGSPEFQRR